MKVLATLGHADGTGSIVEVDLVHADLRTVVSYLPPPELHVPDKGLTGAAWLGAPGQSDLVVCSFNALHRFGGPLLRHLATLHRPDMNDLHGVCCDGERMFVANTGFDAIDVYDLAGSFVGGYRCEPSWLSAERWAGRTPSREDHARLLRSGWTSGSTSFPDDPPTGTYYQGPAAAPFHRRKLRDYVHPNHVALVGDQVLVTRLADRRVVDVARFRVVLEAPAPPHDGVLDGDRFWITCVDGRVLAYEVAGGRVTARVAAQVDVSKISGCYGWCRGLLVTEELVVVGFTAIRREPRYFWRDRDFADTTTAVVALDKTTLSMRARMTISQDYRAPGNLFSIVRRHD